MLDLTIEGPEAGQRQRISLEPGRAFVLGRDPAADISVSWDPFISRRHVAVTIAATRLSICRLGEASTPLFVAGRQVESAVLVPGEHFVLGNTCFIVMARPLSEPLNPPRTVEEVTFTREALQHVQYRDPDRRVEVLSHLPEVIWGARNDIELNVRLVNLLLAGITQADAAGLVEVGAGESVAVLHWDRRHETAGAFQPSRRLVVESIIRRRQSVLNVWENVRHDNEFTATQEFDWAFCTPISGPPGELRGLYLGGRFDATGATSLGHAPPDGNHLQADVKFAELVAEIVGSVRRLNHLERQQAGLRQFLPPAVLLAIGNASDPAALAPREANVTVMFCDLRGFSRQAETARDDLAGLLDRVSQALSVMTRHISANGGVIGDFQGDAAMSFWGWPVATEDDPLKACRTALAIRAEFAAAARAPSHPLTDFRMGIGLACGRAVAGRIGTGEHFVFTAFGPVVNLASRLEGMTRQLHVPIIVDESLAQIIRARLPADEGRLRLLAKVLPYGMETPEIVSELLPGERQLPELTDEHLAAFDKAAEQFIAGRWDEAYTALRALPPGDRAQDFLAGQIVAHNRQAPPDWTGVVKLPSK